MSSNPTRRQWIILILVNVIVSAFTTWVVVRSLTAQPVLMPVDAQKPAQQIAADAPQPTDTAAPADTPANTPPPTPTPVPAQPTKTPTARTSNTPTPTPQPTRTAAATATLAAAPQVQISTVLYPGQRQREVVVIVNEGDSVSMKGWTLTSTRNITYVFGDVTIPNDSFVSLHTTTGSDVATDLFMNRSEPSWQVGDVLTLALGNQQLATYTVTNQ